MYHQNSYYHSPSHNIINYLTSSFVSRCFIFAWLAENSARSLASRVWSVSTVFSSFLMLSSMQFWVSLARLKTSSSRRPSFLSNWQPLSVKVALAWNNKECDKSKHTAIHNSVYPFFEMLTARVGFTSGFTVEVFLYILWPI